jgi:hypothetical protein
MVRTFIAKILLKLSLSTNQSINQRLTIKLKTLLMVRIDTAMFHVRQPEGVVKGGYDHVPMDGYLHDNTEYA